MATGVLSRTIERRPRAARKAGRPWGGDLLWSLGDGAAYGGMVGFGETFLPAFVLAVGLGEITAGLIASVPLIAGGVMPSDPATLAYESDRNRRRSVMWFSYSRPSGTTVQVASL